MSHPATTAPAIQSNSAWGASVHLQLAFRARTRFVHSARNLISDMCAEYLEPSDNTAHVVMATNELLENIVKYSSDGRGSVEFDLALVNEQPTVRMRTQNIATPSHLQEACRLLTHIIAVPNPLECYEELIASSGERIGSGLGLVRIRAEANLVLNYRITANILDIEATGPVEKKKITL